MKPYQVHLFSDESKIPEVLPSEACFVYEDKKYLNFLIYDCFHLRNSEYLKDVAISAIQSNGIVPTGDKGKLMQELQQAMLELKQLDAVLVFPDEIAALVATLSIFGPKTTIFIDYDTCPSLIAALQQRNVEYYDHNNIEQLDKLLSAKSDKVIVVDGVYEWRGKVGAVNEIITLAHENECIIIANEINSFGLLGRQGRGFVDLFNVYSLVNIDIGCFSRFVGGFGCYVGAKKYLINKIRENISEIFKPLPQFMIAVNLAGLEPMKIGKNKNNKLQLLWKNSRYFITRLKQIGFTTNSDTPMVVVDFHNEEEAGEFAKRLFFERIIVAQNKERIKLNISVEHNKEDLDYCLSKFEELGADLGILT
jgi:7-keto-8-aminopelargonate synthetase-like enzyme